MTSKTATERMEGARRAKTDAITRELLWACIGSRLWTSFVTEALSPRSLLKWLLVLETPAGRLVYRLSDEELLLFEHLPVIANDGKRQDDKAAILYTLAVDGWHGEPNV